MDRYKNNTSQRHFPVLFYIKVHNYIKNIRNETAIEIQQWSGPLDSWSRLANKDINILNVILKGVWREQ